MKHTVLAVTYNTEPHKTINELVTYKQRMVGLTTNQVKDYFIILLHLKQQK